MLNTSLKTLGTTVKNRAKGSFKVSRQMGWKNDGGLLLDVKKRFASEQKKNAATKIFQIQKSAL